MGLLPCQRAFLWINQRQENITQLRKQFLQCFYTCCNLVKCNPAMCCNLIKEVLRLGNRMTNYSVNVNVPDNTNVFKQALELSLKDKIILRNIFTIFFVFIIFSTKRHYICSISLSKGVTHAFRSNNLLIL